MPKSLEEIIAHAEEYAARFETYEPRAEDEIDVAAHRELREAVAARAHAEARLAAAVSDARKGNLSWALIGTIVGTSGEAARQRYGGLKRAGA